MPENAAFEISQNNAPATNDSLNIIKHTVHGLFYLELDIGDVAKVEKTLNTYVDEVKALPFGTVQSRLQLDEPHPIHEGTSKKLLREQIAASLPRSPLVYLIDMSRGFAAGLLAFFRGAQESKSLWEDTDIKGLALDDFYPHVRQSLGEKTNRALLCKNLKLSNDPIKEISQIKAGKPRIWHIPLGKASEERCGEDSIALQFSDARMYLFRTGIVIIDLMWAYLVEEPLDSDASPAPDQSEKKDIKYLSDNLPASIVLEGNYFLSHGQHKIKKTSAQNNTPNAVSNVLNAHSLRKIAQALLPETWGEIHPGRLQLHTVCQVEDTATRDDLRQLAIRLSHRQTKDYVPDQHFVDENVLNRFSYTCHAIALEGAASVVVDTPLASESVKGFVSGTGSNTYVPLYIASLHNHLWLLSQSVSLPSRNHGDERNEARSLEMMYERMVEFRRYFYHQLVSQITLHNEFFQRSQDVFRINERQQQLERSTYDVAEIIKARRSRWFGRASGAVAGFLVAYQLLDIVAQSFGPPDSRVWMVKTATALPAELNALVNQVETWDQFAIVASLLGALIGFLAVWYFDKSSK